MSLTQFSSDDLDQISRHGIQQEQALTQLEALKKPPPFLILNRPCTLGDGICKIPSNEHEDLFRLHREMADQGRCLKFVPASGAASRMFKSLLWFHGHAKHFDRDDMIREAGAGEKRLEDILAFVKGLEGFAFFDDLKHAMAKEGLNIHAEMNAQNLEEALEFLLTPRGLGYANLPKGLLKFHRYPEGSRTAFEEHLVEAAEYVRDSEGKCRLHFTVSPEHRRLFEKLLEEVRPFYGEVYDAQFQVDFSLQKPGTDTIAVDAETRPFRFDDGTLLFRPAGHGALLDNLNDLRGDIIFIKNIDNVVPDRLKKSTYRWKKVLAGYLVQTQDRVHSYVKRLEQGDEDRALLDEAVAFAEQELNISAPKSLAPRSFTQMRKFLLSGFNRPLRVCGVVRNVGEPGGGPFWVEREDGSLTPQIVEKAQVDLTSADQEEIWFSATHFNPVDIVCGVLDHRGDPFDLRRYVDPNAYIITSKSEGGRELRALELPGLWNGAMAHWNTIFVEVPIETFNPVKTVLDLLREEHQPVSA